MKKKEKLKGSSGQTKAYFKKLFVKSKKVLQSETAKISSETELTTRQKMMEIEQWQQLKWQQAKKTYLRLIIGTIFLCLIAFTVTIWQAQLKLNKYQQQQSVLMNQQLAKFTTDIDSITSSYKMHLYMLINEEIKSDSFRLQLETNIKNEFNNYAPEVLLPAANRMIERKLKEVKLQLNQQLENNVLRYETLRTLKHNPIDR